MGTSSIQNDGFGGAPSVYPEEVLPLDTPEILEKSVQQRFDSIFNNSKIFSFFGGFSGAACSIFAVGATPAASSQPIEKDQDKDGIPDILDACKDIPGIKSHNPNDNGCPLEKPYLDKAPQPSAEGRSAIPPVGKSPCRADKAWEIRHFIAFKKNEEPVICSAISVPTDKVISISRKDYEDFQAKTKFLVGLYHSLLEALKLDDSKFPHGLAEELLFNYNRMFVDFINPIGCYQWYLKGNSKDPNEIKKSESYLKELENKTLPEAEKALASSYRMARETYDGMRRKGWDISCVPEPILPVIHIRNP